MSTPNHIQDELKGLNSELPSANGTPFSVPEGYFEGLAGAILNRVKQGTEETAATEIEALSPLLAGISRAMPYHLPEGFFEQSVEVLPAITSVETSTLLASIGKQMPMDVPAGYFENLADKVLERTGAKRAKVVSMGARKWMRMAVAAVMIGIVTVSGLFYFGNNKTQVPAPGAPIAQQLKTVSTKELDDFVKAADVASSTPVTAQSSPAKKEVKQMLQDVSDKELDAFLEQVPTDDEETMIN